MTTHRHTWETKQPGGTFQEGDTFTFIEICSTCGAEKKVVHKPRNPGGLYSGHRMVSRKITPARVTNPKTARVRRRNSSEEAAAADVSAEFHGRPARIEREIETTLDVPLTLTELGRLIRLELKGGYKLDFDNCGIRLACRPTGTRSLYFEGGDQSLPLRDLGITDRHDYVPVGKVRRIAYLTKKAMDNFENIEYVHTFGEEGGTLPTLNYDTRNRLMFLAGGAYQVKAEGITN